MGQVITDLTNVYVAYLARDGSTYKIPMRRAYLNVFTGDYKYVLASPFLPLFLQRPAQITIAASNGGELVRRRIPYCTQDLTTADLPNTIVVDNLTWTLQNIRQERRLTLKLGYPS